VTSRSHGSEGGSAGQPAGPTRRGKLRAWLVCESSTGELLVEHPDADQHRRHGPRPPTLTSQLSTASHGLFRFPNYGERRRAGEAISTAFTESAVNQVISKPIDRTTWRHADPVPVTAGQ
jgi:hypothetical protein